MINDNNAALIEMLFFFGVFLLLAFYQLWSVRRDSSQKKRAQDRREESEKL